LKSIAAVRRRENEFLKFLILVVEARLKAAAEGHSPPDDMLTWIIKKAALLLSGLETGRKDLAKGQKRCDKDAISIYIGVWTPATSKSILPPP